MKESSENLYNDRLGEDFNDLGAAIATVRQVSQSSGEELEKMTKNAIVFRDVFGEDITQSVKASDTMMRNFKVTSEQAYNLLAQGAQKGLNKSDELIDTANEYSIYYKTLGYSANEMFNQFAAGLEAGAFNLDKVGDAVKEFGIRIKDGSSATQTAMSILFAPENIEVFTQKLTKGSEKSAEYLELLKHVSKDTAAQLVKDLKAGGTKSAKAFEALQGIMGGGNKILSDLSSGAIQGKDAMQMVIDKLGEIKDPIQKSTLGVALFGTQFEDMESGVIAALGTARQQFDMTKQTMEEVAKVKYDTLSKDFQAIGRQLMTDLVIPIGEKLMPLLQGLADWMADNQDLLMVIALGVPAAALAKNTVSIVKKLGLIGSAASGAGGAASGFGKVLGLLTNPIGIAVGALGALTLGVMAYKKHQEKARDELLNMGEALETAYSDFDVLDHANKRTQNLTREYDRLTEKIGNAQTPADELTEARRKLEQVESDLIEMNPDIISAEDRKTDRFREQIDLLGRINEAQAEMGRRDLEHAALEAKAKFPELEAEYIDSTDDLKKQNEAYEKLRKSYADYVELNAQYQNIDLNVTDGDERGRKFEELAAKATEITGKVYSGQGFGLVFGDDFRELEGSFEKYHEKIKAIESDMKESEASMSNYYDMQVKMIENDLGGSIESMAAKYKDASDQEQLRFRKAAELIAQLNDEVNLLPAEKKVDLELVWKQTGQVPDTKTAEGRKLSRIALKDPGFEGYAEGGIATRPSIFGEAGPEIAIPLNNKPRSRSLLDMANDLMGYTSTENNQGNVVVHYSPSITLPGADPSIMQMVNEALRRSEDGLERRLKGIMQQQRRVSLS
nr:phage tail tape measure protein [Paenibacillus piscarius]